MEAKSKAQENNYSPLAVYGNIDRIKCILYWFIITILIALFTSIPIVLFNHDIWIASFISVAIPMVLGSLFLLQRDHFEGAAIFLALILLSLLTIIATLDLGIHNLSNLGYPIVLIISGLVTRKRALTFLTLFTIGCTGWLVFGELAGIYTPSTLNQSVPGDFFTAMLIISITAVFVRFLTNTLLENNRLLQEELRERKEIEKQREALIIELENKNTELERFTYTVSHDLKSPLVTIGGFLGYLEEDAHSGNIERLQQDIQRINSAAKKMKSLLDELLELSRIGRIMNPPENISFQEIVQEALENIEGRLNDGKIEVRVRSDLPVVWGDRARLVEVMQNLLDNAAKFTQNNADPLIEVGCRQEGDKQIFFVKDNGIGIEPQYHSRVFELFDKLDPNSEGTGIGLALVKRIVNVHNGKIWVESQGKCKGTIFCFTLHQK